MFWYEDEVKEREQKPVLAKGEKTKVVFYGSSSIRLWETLEEDFPYLDIINQAFGGSTLAACAWFFKRIVPQHKPEVLVLYAGDNDLGDGRHPEEVFFSFKALMNLIKRHCGQIPVAFLSVKPTPAREHLINSVKYTNKIIKEEIEAYYPNCTFVDIYNPMLENGSLDKSLYEEDELHLSPAGYKVWKKVLSKDFLDQFAQ